VIISMPVYEYECGSCRHRFEKRQGFDDEPKAVCPRCEGKARRVFHAAPVIFKGSGFYVTDHRKNTGPDSSPEKKETKSEPSAGKSKSESAAAKGN
jgi:putative FmdB family regulatory protein